MQEGISVQNSLIKVSVICLTYNHEKHIARTLDGFVNQKTDFAFEVLVHDDCSTDGTADIVRDYAEKYPDIIKPILQAENQYSKGVWIDRDIVAPKAKGDYVAFCEGDDYWCDMDKLQKQYDFLSAHPEYSACVHKTVFHNLSTGKDVLVPNIDADRDYSLEEIVLAGGGIFGTNSAMMRTEISRDMPESFRAKGFSDFQLFLYAAAEGKVHCLNEAMSVYNVGVAGSWTQTMMNDVQRRIDHCEVFIDLIDRIDAYYNEKFHSILLKKKQEMEYLMFKLKKDRKAMFRPEYRQWLVPDIKLSVKLKIAALCPSLVKLAHRVKGS